MESVPHMAEEVRALTLMLPFNSPRVHPWSHTWPYVHLYGQVLHGCSPVGVSNTRLGGPTGVHPWGLGNPDGGPTGVHPWESPAPG